MAGAFRMRRAGRKTENTGNELDDRRRLRRERQRQEKTPETNLMIWRLARCPQNGKSKIPERT